MKIVQLVMIRTHVNYVKNASPAVMVNKDNYVVLDKHVHLKHVEIVRVVKDVIAVMRTVMTAKAVTIHKGAIAVMVAVTRVIIQKIVEMKIPHVVAVSVVTLLVKLTNLSHVHIVMVDVMSHKAVITAILVIVVAVTLPIVTHVVTVTHAMAVRGARAATGRTSHVLGARPAKSKFLLIIVDIIMNSSNNNQPANNQPFGQSKNAFDSLLF